MRRPVEVKTHFGHLRAGPLVRQALNQELGRLILRGRLQSGIISANMPLAAGTLLGPYEIGASLGAGGMGEVYRARDIRLDRTVAIKILPQQLSNDPSRRQRFEREAKTISSFNHPHICLLYDIGHQDGIDYLVMECIEGESLAERLRKGPLPLDQVLKYGAQISLALDQAHRSGVVHRDLKPGNIMLTPTGAKLLDFGLAKPCVLPASGETLTDAIRQSPATDEGIIVGTFQYMSPEQVEGKELDGRSDIFSLGAALYEMLTGHCAFQGKSQLSVASAILEKDPVSVASIVPTTPPALDHAIRRCLAKDLEERWQSARDLALELKWMAEASSQTGALAPGRPRNTIPHWLGWGAAILLIVVVSALNAYLYWDKKQPAAVPVRFEIPLPAGSLTFTLSPNGHQLAIQAPGPDGRKLIWIRALDSLETHPLPGTEDVLGPPVIWSPDSRLVAFQAGNKLKKIDISGCPPQAICNVSVSVMGGAWNRDDTIIFGTVGDGIMRVSAGGGVPSLLTTTGGRNEVHTFPFFLSDGKHFVYLRAPENPGIYSGSIELKPEQQSSKQILGTPLMADYLPSTDGGRGRLLFMREGTLLTQLFDERRLEPVGEPVSLAEHVGSFLLSASFSVSANGVLAYRAGKTAIPLSGLNWYSRQGEDLGSAGEFGTTAYTDLALSPEGTRLATTRVDPKADSEQSIWLLDLIRGVNARFTFDVAPDFAPVWSPDGTRIAYGAWRSGGSAIYQKLSNGAGKEQVLVNATNDSKVPNDWSRDNRFLLYTQQDARMNADLWVLPLSDGGLSSGVPTPFANTQFNEAGGQFSPDARWIAFTSDESGKSEVYVQPFPTPPGGGGKIPVSRGGGNQPRWRRDGKELFYLSLDAKLMAVDVIRGFDVGPPKPLFQTPASNIQNRTAANGLNWDVTADGQRFLFDETKASSDSLTVVLNWTADLKNK
jgi:serine/threonine protein kinase